MSKSQWVTPKSRKRVRSFGRRPPGQAQLPRIFYALESEDLQAYFRAQDYKRYRPYILGAIIVWMLITERRS